ncbi:unnamed protein product [Acanthoscelides obtectus]|uniref:Uncharacterized protein n=1 Tax=Acanthoscelides obtectus TaxID=200917 RepID=A0A9P0MN16_ACAOB|nr:unnamed protein product [Acanthoscelides obtectus]CAK1684908.1 hypothetical protein AOBTE_LOCUS35164 [Acanthoscelides obtectus]
MLFCCCCVLNTSHISLISELRFSRLCIISEDSWYFSQPLANSFAANSVLLMPELALCEDKSLSVASSALCSLCRFALWRDCSRWRRRITFSPKRLRVRCRFTSMSVSSFSSCKWKGRC